MDSKGGLDPSTNDNFMRLAYKFFPPAGGSADIDRQSRATASLGFIAKQQQPKELYRVVQQTSAEVGHGALFGSDKAYVLGGANGETVTTATNLEQLPNTGAHDGAAAAGDPGGRLSWVPGPGGPDGRQRVLAAPPPALCHGAARGGLSAVR